MRQAGRSRHDSTVNYDIDLKGCKVNIPEANIESEQMPQANEQKVPMETSSKAWKEIETETTPPPDSEFSPIRLNISGQIL